MQIKLNMVRRERCGKANRGVKAELSSCWRCEMWWEKNKLMLEVWNVTPGPTTTCGCDTKHRGTAGDGRIK